MATVFFLRFAPEDVKICVSGSNIKQKSMLKYRQKFHVYFSLLLGSLFRLSCSSRSKYQSWRSGRFVLIGFCWPGKVWRRLMSCTIPLLIRTA